MPQPKCPKCGSPVQKPVVTFMHPQVGPDYRGPLSAVLVYSCEKAACSAVLSISPLPRDA